MDLRLWSSTKLGYYFKSNQCRSQIFVLFPHVYQYRTRFHCPARENCARLVSMDVALQEVGFYCSSACAVPRRLWYCLLCCIFRSVRFFCECFNSISYAPRGNWGVDLLAGSTFGARCPFQDGLLFQATLPQGTRCCLLWRCPASWQCFFRQVYSDDNDMSSPSIQVLSSRLGCVTGRGKLLKPLCTSI